MDKLIGKYKVHLEETGLILTHKAGISFDMTPDEIEGLIGFLNVHWNAIRAAQPDAAPRLKPVTNEESSVPAHNWADLEQKKDAG